MPLLAIRKASMRRSWESSQIGDVETLPNANRSAWSFGAGLLPHCANPGCRSSWLHLFRHRSTPVFEGGWTCSPVCTEARIRLALERELDGLPEGFGMHHHRTPLGLLMLEQGWITREQLHRALVAQRGAGSGRLGEWLIRQGSADEMIVTRALGIQWSCPVLCPPLKTRSTTASVVPRLFLDAFGVIPLRVAGQKLLYLGFEEGVDPVLAFAVQRMTGFRVESGIVPSSVFHAVQETALSSCFPPLQLGEAVTVSAAAHMLARAIERTGPAASRLVRVHDCLWLRMILAGEDISFAPIDAVRDVVCSIGKIVA